MEHDDQKELQLLPGPPSSQWIAPRPSDPSPLRYRSAVEALEAPNNSLDLQLSISVRPLRSLGGATNNNVSEYEQTTTGLKPKASCVEALKWQAAEQIRMAAMEKAYAERVRELTRREMELAQSEFTRARHMWERAREEVEKAERMKEKAMRQMDATCMEITCQSCRQRFRP
ncbi:protein indeterminate-domain 16 [Argentina anserina]|uniref:protein indeterminate-domain 16 n=1 Tax=Argentina anserina TaxID=57926 RepID=UPI0021766460|nr:protein indeterminate-domain 16 [Potentilla anserina]